MPCNIVSAVPERERFFFAPIYIYQYGSGKEISKVRTGEPRIDSFGAIRGRYSP